MGKNNPFGVIQEFEEAVANYAGAKYCVAVNSCTNALKLSLAWQKLYGDSTVRDITIPNKTYVSVPIQILKAGFNLEFEDRDWSGIYRLFPTNIFDSARRFTYGMYISNSIMCTSHHWTKTLGIQHGGCILHDDDAADIWFRKMRHDGRTDGAPITNETVTVLGEHCVMPPENAAAGLVRLASLPWHNEDLPNPVYPDLSEFDIFKPCLKV